MVSNNFFFNVKKRQEGKCAGFRQVDAFSQVSSGIHLGICPACSVHDIQVSKMPTVKVFAYEEIGIPLK